MDEQDTQASIFSKLQQHYRHLSAVWSGKIKTACTQLHAYLMRQPPRRRGVLLLGMAAAALFGLLLLYALLLIPFTPSIKDLKQARAAQASVLLSADG